MEKFLINPEKNQKCIWMSAGIVNYKLCNCEFQCENCAFDKVMLLQDDLKKPVGVTCPEGIQTETDNVTRALINRYLISFLAGFNIHLERFYHPSHFWYKIESDNTIAVGVNRIFLKILEPFQYLELPHIEEEYQKNQIISTVYREENEIPLKIAVAGKIMRVNEEAFKDGVQSNSDDDSYYFKMEVKDMQEITEQLCTTICGLKYFIDTISLLSKYLSKTFRWYRSTHMGMTLADGGQMQLHLEKVLGEEEYQQLLNELI
jgi:glycine cleavage system H protein